MQFNHYIEVSRTPKANLSIFQLIEHVTREIHHFNRSECHPEQVALSLPEFAVMGSVGNRVQIFGSISALEHLFNQSGFAYLLKLKDCFVTSVREVPAETKYGYCAFVRDRNYEKRTASYIAKSEDRAIRRAMENKNTRLTNSEDLLKRRHEMKEILMEETDKPQPLRIAMNSAASRQGFSLFIAPIKFESHTTGQINSYGLSSRTQPCTLPIVL